MTIEVKVPDIGADEIEVTKILVKMGGEAEAEQPLITVGGDKAFMEVPSPQADIVKKIKVPVGDKTQADVLVMILDPTDGAADAASTQAEEKRRAIPAVALAATAAKDVSVPDIGSNEVEVAEILVKVGDKVEAEQSLITTGGDKALTEIPAPFTGTVKEIKVNVDDKVSTGSLTMVFEVAGRTGAAAPAAKQKAASATAPAPATGVKKVNVPDTGDDGAEATEVVVRVGDKVTAEQSLTTVEGNKASMGVPAPLTGVVKEPEVNVGDKVKAGLLIMVFEIEDAVPAAAPAKREAAAPALAAKAETPAVTLTAKVESKSELAEDDACVHMAPLIRRLTCEFDVNLMKVKGTGCKGRILYEGVRAYMRETIKHVEAVPIATGGGIPGMLSWPRVDFSGFGGIEEVELGRIQKIPDADLSRNWVVIPHVTHFDKTDIIELEAFREQQNEEAVKHKPDVKITPVVFVTKAVAAALEQMLHFNGSLSEGGQRLILKEYIDIGVAVDTPNGLVILVFKNVNKESVIGLSRKLVIVFKKTRDGRPTASEIQGGCFTISSIDSPGATHFAPIVNAPEVAIPGVSESAMESAWNDKEFVPCLALPISLSFDYRVIDGVNGAHFITIISNMLSDTRRLAM